MSGNDNIPEWKWQSIHEWKWQHTRVEVTEHTWVDMTTYQSGSDRAFQNENDTQAVTQLHFLLFHRKYAAVKCYSLLLLLFFHREQKACLAYFSAQPCVENILVKTLLMYDPPAPPPPRPHHENILVMTLLMYDTPAPPPPTHTHAHTTPSPWKHYGHDIVNVWFPSPPPPHTHTQPLHHESILVMTLLCMISPPPPSPFIWSPLPPNPFTIKTFWSWH